ncbi:TetR/AcrR family transcriptional regulator [Metabacillus sediminilitoris]|uniref:TetR/AcrR family transcriptional regulator n=1 Tax=Metabacillus sediminilitoris TaxID=2567941 RepID=A0A4S4C1M7_9BACI|nr:TetR/AcrR family transcriptional regulator [Metabacillus sediminilitoris]QGQ48076.1 TetR family transcriptional regulator [Metabacillus sediminilitoris]THF81562.1 TetR/AcrR family transcriptional regulator [Metabacillus sediminilitoris]
MKEKEKKIIEAGISLFAKKGYSSTSIQEIVDACGISKGAFYLYFKSKEALMLAVFKYQFQSIQERLDSLALDNLSPREIFIAQLEAQLAEIYKNKEFIIMQIREQAIPLNPEIEAFIRKMSQEIGSFYHSSLLAIYGEKAAKYVFDLNMILQGITHAYVKLMMFDKANVDLRKLSTYILNRMDDLVAGYIRSNEEPILTDDFVNQLSELYPEPNKEDVIRHINLAKDRIKHEDTIITLDVLAEEIMLDSPRIPVIQGMLGNIKNEPTLQSITAMIEKFFKLDTK